MVELASDFLDRNTPIFRDDVCFFISQSGTLEGFNGIINFGKSVYIKYNASDLRTGFANFWTAFLKLSFHLISFSLTLKIFNLAFSIITNLKFCA